MKKPDDTPLFPLLAISRLRMGIDGKGVTSLVAGAGCPLRCKWCINKKILQNRQPEYVTPETLFERLRIDNLYFQATGGGVCFGGGESLLHTPFIGAFRALTGGAWKITAETSLNVPEENVREALDCVDELIVDIKTADPAIYRSYTGGENGRALQNLTLLVPYADRTVIRVPLIPSFNDGADREKTVALMKSMGFETFDLFEYRVVDNSR